MKAEARWDRQALLDSPLFTTVRSLVEALPADRFPDNTSLNALAERQGLVNAQGLPVRFVTQTQKVSAAEYEGRAWARGEVLTRPHNWHDLFNALAWLVFPRTKAVINRLHIEELARQAGRARSVARDVLTLLDESGMAVACSRPQLIELLRGFQWKALFVMHREAVRAHMAFRILGHAVHEKAVVPYKGIVAHALCVAVEDDFFALPEAVQNAALDAAIAEQLVDEATLRDTASLQPVPILGIPGWCAANEDPAYYDDTGHFRPGRTRRPEVRAP